MFLNKDFEEGFKDIFPNVNEELSDSRTRRQCERICFENQTGRVMGTGVISYLLARTSLLMLWLITGKVWIDFKDFGKSVGRMCRVVT